MTITTTYNLETIQAEFRANEVTDLSQNVSNVVGLSNGGFAVVYSGEANFDRIPWLAIYSSPTDTTPTTVGIFDNSGTGYTDMIGEPVVTELADGTIAVVWKEGVAGDNKMVATFVNATSGEVVAREVQVTGASDGDPEVAALGGDIFALVVKTGMGVAVRTLTTDGVQQSAVGITGAEDAAVARLSDGRFVVTYTHAGSVNARMFEANGIAVAGIGEIAVGSGGASSSQVAALKNGGFAVVFDDATFNGGSEPGIGLVIVGANGVAGSVIRVDTFLSDREDSDPEITVLANGYIVVTWTHQFGPSDGDVHSRYFDQSGNAVSGGIFAGDIPLDNTGANEGQSSVAALRNGQFVTTWTDSATPGDPNGTGISATVRELTRTQTSDGASDSFQGDELLDKQYGFAGNDTFRLASPGHVVTGEIYDGGDDTDTFLADFVFGTFDFRPATIANMEVMQFISQNGLSEAVVRFTAGQMQQFGSVALDASINTSGGGQAVEVFMATSNALNLSGVAVSGAGTKGVFRIYGDANAESITGSSIADRIDTGAGNDTLNGWLGRDVLLGGLGNDTYVLGSEASGTDAVQDSGGIDTITSMISRRLDFFDFSEIENLRLWGTASTSGVGNRLANTIIGNAGRNTLDGGIGNDRLYGIDGNDRLFGGHGYDRLYGGAGNDTLDGGTHNDTLYGDAGRDRLFGGNGNDRLYGGNDNDTLDGGSRNDRLDGGRGNDILIGNAGKDTLIGGIGNDTFRFTNKAHSRGSLTDIIIDFDDRGRGNDRIDVSKIFGPKLSYIHDDAFTTAGQLRINDVRGADVIVEINTGGSLAADFSIRLKATTLASMTASDFVL